MRTGAERRHDGISRSEETVSQLPLTVFLDDPLATRVDLTGGKGVGLAVLESIPGIRVPQAYIITTSLDDQLLGQYPNIREEINELDRLSEQWLKAKLLQREIEAQEWERQIAASGELLKATMGRLIIPQGIRGEIGAAYGQLSQRVGEKNVAVAVRSSGTAEDGDDNSFAGQYASFLHQQGEAEVIGSVQGCLVSQFTDRVITYRNNKRLEKAEKVLRDHPGEIERALSASEGLSHKESKLAVVVQKMINSSVSGVGLSIDPITAAPIIYIELNHGIGESVVGGEVTPDCFWVDPKTLKITGRRLGAKGVKTSYVDGGTQTVEVSEADQMRYSATDAKVEELAGMIKKIKDVCGWHVDTEFAFDEQGEINFTQSRPETTASKEDPMIVKIRVKGVPEDVAENAEVILKGGMVGAPGAAAGTKLYAETVGEAMEALESAENKGKKMILVTDMTKPDWVPVMKSVAGITTRHGGRNCHAAIVSRELGVPCLVGLEGGIEALKSSAVSDITLDVGQMTVYESILPLEEVGEDVDVREMLANPTETVIGINMAMPDEARKLHPLAELGKNFKISLLRTEFLLSEIGHVRAFVDFDQGKIDPSSDLYKEVKERIARAGCRSAEEYFITTLSEGYGGVASVFPNSEVVLRTTDFKTNEYANLLGGEKYETAEENPMMGWRGLVRSLSPENREAFKWELQAIKRAREMGYKNIEIMFPMVRDLMELTGGPQMEERYGKGFKGAYEIMGEVGMGEGIDGLKLVMMVEVPADVVRIRDFITAGKVKRISFGTNDLTQLTLGVDRDNERMQKIPQYNETNPAVVEQVRSVIRVCKELGVETGICGNAPSNYPEFAQMLVEAGVDSMGVTPDRYLATYRLVREAEQKREAAAGGNGQGRILGKITFSP